MNKKKKPLVFLPYDHVWLCQSYCDNNSLLFVAIIMVVVVVVVILVVAVVVAVVAIVFRAVVMSQDDFVLYKQRGKDSPCPNEFTNLATKCACFYEVAPFFK